MKSSEAANKLEDLCLIKNKIENEKDDDSLLSILKRVDKMDITYDDLHKTQLHKSVVALAKSKSKELAALSKEIISKWKTLKKNPNSSSGSKQSSGSSSIAASTDSSKKTLSTRVTNTDTDEENYLEITKIFDSSSPPIRKTIKKNIFDALLNKEKGKPEEELKFICDLTLEIEQSLFKHLYNTGDKGMKYVNKAKAIVLNVKLSEKTFLRENILGGVFTPKQLAEMDVSEMASEDMKKQREKIANDSFTSRQTDWGKKYVSEHGEYKCGKCQSRKTSYYQQQIRSADEPMTTFITCHECGHQWKHN